MASPLPSGAAGQIGPNIDPCGVHYDNGIHINEVKVLPVERINVTFPTLPQGVTPPFNVSHSYYLPDLQICGVGQLSGVPNSTNDTWFEWDAHPFNRTTRDPKSLGEVGQSYIFSLYQVQPENGGQFPYWLSANYTIVDQTGAGARTRGTVMVVGLIPTLLLVVCLLEGLLL